MFLFLKIKPLIFIKEKLTPGQIEEYNNVLLKKLNKQNIIIS